MSAAIDDMIGEAVASISFALRAAVMAVGRRQSISTGRRRVRRPKPAGCVEPITKDSLDPIHDGDSIPGCVHNPNEPARRPGPAAADAACGPGRDRASTADHRDTAAQSLRPALGEAAVQLGIEDLEQSVAEQAALLEAAASPAISPQQNGSARAPRTEPVKRNRGALPADLPRVEQVIDVEDKACPCCGGQLHPIGEDTAEMLDYVPAHLRVRVIRRPRYGCRSCAEGVVQAPAPDRPIDGGMATEALLAHVLVSKYCDSLPLYRQSEIFARQGIKLDRSTLCNWVGRACWWLAPMHELLLSTVLASPVLFADDTTLPVLDPGRGRTKTGRLWCYAIDPRPWNGPGHPAAAYVYSEDRKGVHPASHLQDFAGVIQVDGYQGFGAVLQGEHGDTRELAYCFAHARRKFYDLYVFDASPIAGEALQRIAGRCDSNAAACCSRRCMSGSCDNSRVSPAAPTLPRRSDTR